MTTQSQSSTAFYRAAIVREPAAWIAAALVLSLFACGKAKEKESEVEPPRPVQVEAVRRGPMDRIITANAALFPINQANVTPKISSPVKKVFVNRGDHVKEGQVIAELESADLSAAVNESKGLVDQAQAAFQTTSRGTVEEDKAKATADLQAARGTLEAAKKVYDNRVELVKQGALAQKLADDASVTMLQAQSAADNAQHHLDTLNQVSQREQVRSAQAVVNAAQAHADNLEAQLGYAKVKSPISGLVADRMVYPGEMAQPGSPLISIVDISQIVARANIPANDALSIKVGSPATIHAPTGDVAASVTVVSPAVDPNTTTVEVWITAPNPKEELRPGVTVSVAIKAETIQDATIVPAEAILNFDEGGQMVMVIDKDNVAHERRVVVGVRQGPNVQIVSGVSEGEMVVTVGGLGLEDKSKVVIQEATTTDDDDDDDK
jgi:multidrug efflux pump subunit AcrA (membrane-fusion protein)